MLTKIKKIFLSRTATILFSFFIGLSIIVGSFIYKVNRVNGYCTTDSGRYCFAGKIKKIKVCCNGLKIEVDKPLDGTFMFTSSSKLYMWWNLSQGQCVMGDADPGGTCILIESYCEEEEEVDGTIRMIGTTLKGPAKGTCTNKTGGVGA
ncbi:MAG: hypothetical protein NTZ13_01255 [Candidatus Parcubacteria bacterium]|nr:hypothetical protein [Candidatus Parcubacteria bacterium]